MKVFLKLPGGAEFQYEQDRRPPMSKERFEALCGLLAWAIGALVLVVLITSITGG